MSRLNGRRLFDEEDDVVSAAGARNAFRRCRRHREDIENDVDVDVEKNINRDNHKNVNVNRPITLSNTGVFVVVSLKDSLNDLLDILSENELGNTFEIKNGDKVLGTLKISKAE